MGELVAYCRVSSRSQDYRDQIERLKAAGAVKCFEEKRSGLDDERPGLQRCLEYLREGDTLIVTKLDRLARSTLHLHSIISELERKNVGFRVLDDPTLDTTTRTGRLVFSILASIAEFEAQIRRERQMEGIARAKAEGRSGGRPKRVTDDVVTRVLAMRRENVSIRKAAEAVGFSKATVQKILKQDFEDK